jgi:hypothetical protein
MWFHTVEMILIIDNLSQKTERGIFYGIQTEYGAGIMEKHG